MKHNLTFLSTLLATTILAGNALAEIDCSQYDSSCNNRYCTCSQNSDGTVNVTWVSSDNGSTYRSDSVYSENKQLLENQYSVSKGNYEQETSVKHTYDDLGRLTEETIMQYSSNSLNGIDRYTRGMWQYNSDDPNESIFDAIQSSYTVNGNGSVNITYNNESFTLRDSIILSNANIEEVKKLVNEGDLDKLVAYTGGQIDYYQTSGPNKEGWPTTIETNDRGFSYLPIEYDDSSEGYTTVYEIPEMFVQNEDGSISVYDISAATAGLSREDLDAFIKDADPKDITGATLKGKYDSVVQYMLHGVVGYNASGSDDDASALAEKYHGTPLLYGKKIYTVQEAEEALGDGTKFHVGLTYK